MPEGDAVLVFSAAAASVCRAQDSAHVPAIGRGLTALRAHGGGALGALWLQAAERDDGEAPWAGRGLKRGRERLFPRSAPFSPTISLFLSPHDILAPQSQTRRAPPLARRRRRVARRDGPGGRGRRVGTPSERPPCAAGHRHDGGLRGRAPDLHEYDDAADDDRHSHHNHHRHHYHEWAFRRRRCHCCATTAAVASAPRAPAFCAPPSRRVGARHTVRARLRRCERPCHPRELAGRAHAGTLVRK